MKKWHVEIEVSEEWVENGFELTEDSVMEWLSNAYPFATEDEFSVRVSESNSLDSE
jgi:hypothetical protein